MKDEVYRVTLELPLLAQAASADEIRRRITGMDIEDILREVDQGDWIGGTLGVARVEHIPAGEVHDAAAAYGSDGDFFGETEGDDDDQGEGP